MIKCCTAQTRTARNRDFYVKKDNFIICCFHNNGNDNS